MVDLTGLSNQELLSLIKSKQAGTIENYCAVKELCKRSEQALKKGKQNDHISSTR